jgi:anthranilate synthase/aminodeoxychorismate synthase-like glutamine amidotransferase
MILFVDSFDSFSWNIVDYLHRLGSDVMVCHNQQLLSDLNWEEITAVVLGPGPGRPEEAGKLMGILDQCLDQQVPILGICLGMQAIGLRFGATLARAPRAIHGHADSLSTEKHPLFQNLELPLQVGRYHSLALYDVALPLVTLATGSDGTPMVIAHKTLPVTGFQFHPESVLSPAGIELMENWYAPLSLPDEASFAK